MRIKKYNQFISEQSQSEIEESDIVAQKMDEFTELKKDIKEKISGAKKVDIKSEGDEFIKEFIQKYTADSKKYKLKDLESDSSMFKFYEENSDNIDAILSKEKFFGSSPSELSTYSAYDYTIKATETAIKWLMVKISEDLTPVEDNIEQL
jgi:hypothetical protein